MKTNMVHQFWSSYNRLFLFGDERKNKTINKTLIDKINYDHALEMLQVLKEKRRNRVQVKKSLMI